MSGRYEGHGGDLALAALAAAGVREMFTLSGGHVFPLYDAVVKDDAGAAMRLVDVRHEQTAVFAAEATARLTGKVESARIAKLTMRSSTLLPSRSQRTTRAAICSPAS